MATYNISTLEELQEMNLHLADDCVLLNDIDASETLEWNDDGFGGYKGFIPIGTAAAKFTGTFDGGGHTISNLYMRNYEGNPLGSNYHMGMLGWVISAGGFIKDLTMEACKCDCEEWACTYTGILGSIMDGASGNLLEISNCHIGGEVVNITSYCGGFANTLEYCDVTNSTCSITIVAFSAAIHGLFCAVGRYSDFTDCISGGSMTIYSESTFATNYVGGFIGWVAATCDFLRCTASAAITSERYNMTSGSQVIGGFVGYCQSGFGTSFLQCGATATLLEVGDCYGYMGGFAGISQLYILNECYAVGSIDFPTATVTGVGTFGYIGGMVGSGVAYNSFAKVDVGEAGIAATNAWVGGFCASGNRMKWCYAVGYVVPAPAGTTAGSGGFYGQHNVSGWQTEACFWDTDVSNMTNGSGSGFENELFGKTTALMKTKSTFTDEGWDFVDETLNGLNDYWYIPQFTLAPKLQSNLTLWLSRSGDYDNFEEGVNEDDAFTLTLPTTNEIRWIKGLETLVIGTSESEWKLASNKLDTPLSPQAYSAKEQTTHGSANIQAVSVSSSLLFVDYVRRKIREITYMLAEEKYVAPDMTELAEHITESGIVAMAHQKNPDSIVWAVRTDGTLISMVYDREQDVVAWSRHETDGNVQSVCVVPNENAVEDDVWISVEREGTVCIEKMMPRNWGTNLSNAFYVDSGVTQTSGSTTVTGLSHLVGKQLVVMGDGVELEEENPGDFTVSAGGTITVPSGLSVVHAGLPFEYALKPMRIVLGSPTGTSYGSITRVSEVVLSFLNTLGVNYGDKADNQYAIDFTDPRWENEEYIDGLFSGDVVVAMPGGFSVNNPILITGSGPYPFTLRAMIVRLDKTGR
jgi:hypothetical protein